MKRVELDHVLCRYYKVVRSEHLVHLEKGFCAHFSTDPPVAAVASAARIHM